VNAEHVTLINRPYFEIVDDILTAIVGGVVNEPLIFDVKDDLYPLAQRASDVRGITGTLLVRDPTGAMIPTPYAFQKKIDYIFRESDNAVIWQPGGAKPADETVFYVDYFRVESRSPLSDINVGSVTRTLSEAVGREIATVYQQINEAYLSGFVDTATGLSLDLVVSILGVVRKTREYAVGLVTFFRDPASGDGNITIPEGTALSTDKGEATFTTVQLRTIQRGQARIDVPVRAAGASSGAAGIVKAGEITKTAQPITGINRVTNFEPTILAAEDETDEQLRARAKAALRSLGKATIAALTNAIFEGRAKLAEVYDPNSPALKRSTPGTVILLVESEPERFPSLQMAVEQTRAAGVQATLIARYVFFKPRVRVRIAPGLTPDGKLKLTDEIIQAMQKYVDTLTAGEHATGEKLLEAITSIKEVSKKKGETKIVDVMAWRADVGQPGPEALVKALVDAADEIYSAPATGGAEQARKEALMLALTNVFTAVAPPAPTGRRIPDRSLVQGATGARATDAEIEAGTFQVVSMVGGDKWWVVLDVEPADILLEEV
jgi:hypothetical protein